MSFPRLPLTFPTLLHELNLISIIAILDHEALRDAYSAVATIAEGSYDDVIIRGVMACYISSSEDSWESKSNLLGAAGMGLSDEKVSEMFNLPLSLMTEKDHPSLPGIKIGERSEGRHAGLVKSIGRNLRSVSRSLVKEGYTCMGEVVERAFSEAEEMNMAPQDYVGNTLLTIAPCLGETYEIQGTSECLVQQTNFTFPILKLTIPVPSSFISRESPRTPPSSISQHSNPTIPFQNEFLTSNAPRCITISSRFQPCSWSLRTSTRLFRFFIHSHRRGCRAPGLRTER